ncbi:MAG: cupin domain-containing protein [Sedimenticola sp.]|nr:cupin domain-containing protein [Sedimenticola sp.]
MQPLNLLKISAPPINQEQLETLIQHQHIRLQRIISPAHFRSEPYLQAEDEWVLVLQGEGTLEIEGRPLTLRAGDSLMIPANTPHQVISTSTEPHCIWLTLHLDGGHPAVSP